MPIFNPSDGGGGGGDMTKAIYDPANVNEQLVGLTASQTITNKNISGSTNTLSAIPTSAAAFTTGLDTAFATGTPGANGNVVQWNADGDVIDGGKSVTSLLQNIVEDTTPQLGGELDAGANSIGFTNQTATGDGTTTIDWGSGNKFVFTFGAFNETFTFTDPAKPGNFLLMMIQDGTGGRTATWPVSVKWAAGTAPTLSTDPSATDIISFYFDGTNYYGTASLNFA